VQALSLSRISVSSSLLLKGYDEPEILRSQLSQLGPISAEPGHIVEFILALLSPAGRIRLHGSAPS